MSGKIAKPESWQNMRATIEFSPISCEFVIINSLFQKKKLTYQNITYIKINLRSYTKSWAALIPGSRHFPALGPSSMSGHTSWLLPKCGPWASSVSIMCGWSHPRATESDTLGVSPSHLCFLHFGDSSIVSHLRITFSKLSLEENFWDSELSG